MTTYTWSSLISLPTNVINQINSIYHKGLIIQRFLIESIEEYDQNKYRIWIIDNEGIRWSGSFRKSIYSQLIDAGVAKIFMTPSQELAWKQIKRILEVNEDLLKEECYKYSLYGMLDQLSEDGYVSSEEYIHIRKLISCLPNRFADDFQAYFGEDVPDDAYRV